MKKKRKRKLNKLALGGALIGSALFIFINLTFAYDSQNTHPALTDEAVDFYNLNFPNNPLSQEDKQLLIRGAIEEDVPPRYLNHFYDPVYNRSWSDYTTSKKWALNSYTQQAFTDSAFSYGGFANLFSDNLSPTDFSYPRALHDYASGNRERAMLAMGHVIHLLEDANVPEHTRGDIHLWWHGTQSPYEKTMAKWNPANINIANELYKKSTKPILLNSQADYFDEIARYSNNYFFSEDTIFISRYSSPQKISEKILMDEGLNYKFGMGIDRDGDLFPLFRMNVASNWRNLITETKLTVNSNLILDDYWSRLAPDFVAHGAGALKLFLEQAEKIKDEYAINNEFKRRDSGLVGQFLGFLGFSGGGSGPVIFNPDLIETIISQPMVLGALTDIVDGDINVGNDDNDVGITPTPSPTPLAYFPTSFISPSPSPTPLPSQSPSQSYPSYEGPISGSGGSSVDSVSNNATPTPSPTSTPTPSPSPSVSSTPTSYPSPTPTQEVEPPQEDQPQETPTPTPEAEPPVEVQPPESGGRVVINEIAWMGTEKSSNDEWLELFNTTSESIDLTGWTLKSITKTASDSQSDPIITFVNKTIDPFGFFLLERTDDKPVSDIEANQIYNGGLDNIGEVLELIDGNGNQQDVVSKSDDGWYAGINERVDKIWQRFSMERIDPNKPGNDATNWATNNGLIRNGHDADGNPINGTPGAKNSVYVSQKPSTITDLAIDLASLFFNKVKLFWSAPSDNDTPANGLKYELRYATSSFETITDWDAAFSIDDLNLPQEISFGQLQSASFYIFGYDSDYYFAIKTSDGDQWSDISNQAEYTAEPAIFDDSDAIVGPANPSIQWTFKVPGVLLMGQPAMAPDGTIYISAPSYEFGRKLRLYAVNPDSGVEKWYWENGLAEPSELAVSADGAVYFGQFDPGSYVTALNPDGSQRWQYGIGDRVNNVSIDQGGNVYFTSENRLITKVKPNGQLKWWVHDTSTFGFTPIADVDDDVYIGANISGLPGLYKLDGDDGTLVWQTRASDNFIYSQYDPVYDSDADLFFSITTDYGQILTFDKDDGAITKDVIEMQGMPTTKVTVLPDFLVFGLDFSLNRPASGSLVYAVDKAEKSVIWTFAVDSKVNGQITADSEGNLYFATRSGKVYSLDQNGQERWVLDLRIATDSYPVIWDGAVFISAGGKLFKIAD